MRTRTARLKKSGRYEYLQIVENRRVNKKPVQRVMLILSGRSDEVNAETRKIGRFCVIGGRSRK